MQQRFHIKFYINKGAIIKKYGTFAVLFQTKYHYNYIVDFNGIIYFVYFSHWPKTFIIRACVTPIKR